MLHPQRGSAAARGVPVDAIEAELRAEQLPIDTFSALALDSVLVAKTSIRRTLGFMTEMAAEVGYAI